MISAPFFFFFFFPAAVISSWVMVSSAPFFFFFFLPAAVISSLMVSSAPFFFFFFLPAAVISSFTIISAPFFFFFFFPAVDRSSLFTTVPTAGAANTGVRLVEPRKPSAVMMAVNLRMMDIPLCLFHLAGGRLSGCTAEGSTGGLGPGTPPYQSWPIHDLGSAFKYIRQKKR